MPDRQPLIRAIVRLALTALVTALVVAIGFGLLEMSQNGRFPLEFASILGPMVFVAVLVGVPLIGGPTMKLAKRFGWQRSYILLAILGAIVGGLAILVLQIIVYGPFEGTSPWALFFAIIGAVTGLVAAPVWKLMSTSKPEEATV